MIDGGAMKRRKYPQIKAKHACTGKKRHSTFKEAQEAAGMLVRVTHERISPYKCQFCGHYHAGHTPASIRKIVDNKFN